MLLVKRSSTFNNSSFDFKNDANNDVMGSASDYILIAMIVAMMCCMAVCCVCLFCRESSRFTICGRNCEINDRVANIDDVSELHEVVPLTPTAAATYNLSDIEKKLKSDPPPPQYNEVTSGSVLERLRRKSKRRGLSASASDKSMVDLNAKLSELPAIKNRRTDKRGLSRFFQRSISHQPASSLYRPGLSRSKKIASEEYEDSTASQQFPKSPFPKSASAYLFRSISPIEESEVQYGLNYGKEMQFIPENSSPDSASKDSLTYKEHCADCYDDEVFM